MKKVIYLLIIIISLFLVGCSNSSKNIEDIVGVSFNQIDHIKSGSATNQNVNIVVEEFINNYKNQKYKKISGNYGNTSHVYYVCYDSNNEVLFTIVETGNQDKVFIKKGIFDINKDSSKSLYKLIK